MPDKKPLHEINEGRFMRRLAYRINDDDCWIWASTTRKRVRVDGSIRQIPVLNVRQPNGAELQTYARRFAWEMRFGPIYPADSHIVNICGEDLCVKPDPKHNKPAGPGERWHEQQQALRPSAPERPAEAPKSDAEFLAAFDSEQKVKPSK